MSRAWLAVALAAILAVGAWPHLFLLELLPTSRDAVMWITQSDLSRPSGLRWIFTKSHFVGYRPVAALSFAFTSAVAGLDPLPYRLTDLGLHLMSAVAVALLAWRAAPRLPRTAGLAAAALFLAHPAVSQVVPHLARRGYALATSLSVLGLVLLLTEATGRRAIAAVGVGTLFLAAGALSNEAAYVAFPVAALLAAHRFAASEEGWWWRVAPAGALLPVLLGIRVLVVGGIGGYQTRGANLQKALPVTLSTWEALAATVRLRSDVVRDGGVAVAVLAAAVGLYYLGRAAWGLRAEAPRDARLPALLLAWLIGISLAYAPAGVWFPRQAYIPLAPFALLLAVVWVDTPRIAGGRALLGLHFAPQLLLIGAILSQSPVLWGTDPLKVACWVETDRLTRDLERDLAAVPRGARVRLVLPFYRRPSLESMKPNQKAEERAPLATRQPELWAMARYPIRADTKLLVVQDALAPQRAGVLVSTDDELGVRVASDQAVFTAGHSLRQDDDGTHRTFWLATPKGDRKRQGAWTWFHDGVDAVLLGPGDPLQDDPKP